MDVTNKQIGPYQIEEEIGRGGMATIYRAIDTRNNQSVALKILLPQYVNDPITLRRFRKEGENSKRLRHPNIIKVFEAGVADGAHYIAMEHATGGTLAQMLKQKGRPLTVEEAVPILRRVAAALDYAHSRNILHRDVKPSNVLIGENGQILLSDFGVARQIASDATVVTTIGFSVGTPSYMSPEQAQGDYDLTSRSDIYSLGVVAYAMMTSALPFDADSQLILLRKIIDDLPKSPDLHNPRLPAGVSYALQRVLSKDPQARYATASEFVDALDKGATWQPSAQDWSTLVRATSGRTATQSAPFYAPPPPPQRRSYTGALAVLLGLLAVILAAFALFRPDIGNWLATVSVPASISALFPGGSPPSSQPLPSAVDDATNSAIAEIATATETETTTATAIEPETATPLPTEIPIPSDTPTAEPPTETATPVVIQMVLAPFEDQALNLRLNVPQNWRQSHLGSAIYFEAPDRQALFFIDKLTSTSDEIPVQKQIESYLADVNTPFSSMQLTGESQSKMGDLQVTQQTYDAVLMGGAQAIVRLSKIEQDGRSYLFGSSVVPTNAATLQPIFDSILDGLVFLAEPTATSTETEIPTDTTTPTDIALPTSTATGTLAPTAIPTDTPLPTDTETATPQPTATASGTPSATDTKTDTPTAVPTSRATPTATETSTRASTSTPVPTNTEVVIATKAPTSEPTQTTPATGTETATETATEPPTETATRVPTSTPVPTNTETSVPTESPTSQPTSTLQPTSTPRATPDLAATEQAQLDIVATRVAQTLTAIPTNTPPATATSTRTPLPTRTRTPTKAPSATATSTKLPTSTPSPRPTATDTPDIDMIPELFATLGAIDATLTELAPFLTPTVAAETPTPQPADTLLPPTLAVAPTATSLPAATSVPAAPAVPAQPGLISGFEPLGTWRRGDQPYGQFTQSNAQVYEGAFSAELAYDFPASAGEQDFVVFLAQSTLAIPRDASRLEMQVYGDGSGNFLNVWVGDSDGQLYQFNFGRIRHTGWQAMNVAFDLNQAWPNGAISPPSISQLTPPLTVKAFVLDHHPDSPLAKSSIFLDALRGSGGRVSEPAAAQPAQPATGGQPTAEPTTAQSAPVEAAPAAPIGRLSGRIAVPIFSGANMDILVYNVADGSVLARYANRRQPDYGKCNGVMLANGDGGGNNDLMRVFPDGSTRSVSVNLEDAWPQWSPSCASVAYASTKQGGDDSWRVYWQVDASDRFDAPPLQFNKTDLRGRYTVYLDNWRIAYNGCNYWASGSNCGIYSTDTSGGQPNRASDQSDDIPSDSLGSRILFHSRRSGNWDVWAVNFDGGGLQQLTNSPANDGLATASPDNQHIAFLSNRDGNWAIYVMNPDGSNQQKLFNVDGGYGGGEYDWPQERLSWGD